MSKEKEIVVEMDTDIEIDADEPVVDEIADDDERFEDQLDDATKSSADDLLTMIEHKHKQATNYTDVRLSKLMERMAARDKQLAEQSKQIGNVSKTVDEHTAMIKALGEQQQQIITLLTSQQQPQLEARPIKDVTTDADLKEMASLFIAQRSQQQQQPQAQPQTIQTGVLTPELLEALANANKKQPGIVDNALGTVGSVLHGVVDTAAFLLESTVDLVTFGKAKRDPDQKQ